MADDVDAFLAELAELPTADVETETETAAGTKREAEELAEARKKVVVLEEVVAEVKAPVAVAVVEAPPVRAAAAAAAAAQTKPPPGTMVGAQLPPKLAYLPGAPPPPGHAPFLPHKAPKPVKREAGGKTWEDPILATWPADDFRLFVGNLSPEVTDEMLHAAFAEYPSMQRVRVIRAPNSVENKGYGFVSFSDPMEMVRAMKEKERKLCGRREMMLSRAKKPEDLAKAKEKHGGKRR